MNQLLLAFAALAFLCGCEADPAPLQVFAASSLTDAFEDLGDAYRQKGGDVEFNFAGSQALRTQIEHGAPADVFASANVDHAHALHEAGLVRSPEPFASNGLAVAVPADSELTRFEDLVDAERVVIGMPSVPVGAYTRQLLEQSAAAYGDDFEAAVRDAVVSRESNVRLVLSRVTLGEADAAVVYRTDVDRDDTKLRVVDIPPELDVPVEYVVATDDDGSVDAIAWVSFVRSDEGREILNRHGFASAGAPR